MNPVLIARMKHLFFAGLVVILISFLFTQIKSKRLPNSTITLSGYQAAFAQNPGVHFTPYRPDSNDNDYDDYGGMGIGSRELALLITPRFAGIYFLAALLLTAWAVPAWLANGSNGKVHTKSIAWGLLACLLLAFAAFTFDINHANEALPLEDRFRLRDYMGFGAGFWMYIAGMALVFAGAYIPKQNNIQA